MKLNPRWQWKLTKLEHWIMDRRQEWAQLWKSAKAPHKVCPECRGLVDRTATTCPLCGAALQGAPAGGLTRSMGTLMPKSGFYTATILAVNILLYVGMMMASLRQRPDDVSGLFTGADPRTLINFGADVGQLVQSGEFWRWVTAIFLHAGLLHLGFNSMALYSIGPQMEEIYGRSKFLFIYLLTGVGGYIASFLWSRNHGITVGASGAIFGLIGAMAVYGHRRGGHFGQTIRRAMVQWAIMGLLFGFFFPGVNNVAHIGGLVTGALLAAVINESSVEEQIGGLWGVLEGLSVLIILGAFALNFINYGEWVKYL